LLQILHASFEFGTAIAAPTSQIFFMQSLILALQLQRQLVRNVASKKRFEFETC
jgi:hypothetical protein